MPRVTHLNRQELLKKDLQGFIRSEMKQQDIKQIQMAKLLGITQQNFSYLLSRTKFDFEQLLIIFKELGADECTIVHLMKL